MNGVSAILKLFITTTLLFFTLGIMTSYAGQTIPPNVTTVKSDALVPKEVQVIWRNGFEPCTEKGIDTSEALNGLEIKFANDAAGSALYILACGGPGYNRPYVAIALDDERGIARRVAFPHVNSLGVGTEFVIYNMVWDNDKMQLSAFGKDRGLGDCGIKSIWQWWPEGYDGQFVLVNQKSKSDCDGEIDNFLKVWPPKTWPPKGLADEG